MTMLCAEQATGVPGGIHLPTEPSKPPNWLLALLVLASLACDSRQELSETVEDFCRGELTELELAENALRAGRTDTALGEPASSALSLRVITNFDFCLRTRQVPEAERRQLSTAFAIARSRYFMTARRDLAAAGQQMSPMTAAYRKVLSYPVK